MEDTYLIKPDPYAPKLSTKLIGIDHLGKEVETPVVTEEPLTLYLNNQEIVTLMTIGDHPDLLALGYLFNQHMLTDDNPVTGVEYDGDLQVVVVRTQNPTNFEEKLKKKTRTSGCAQGTVFGDLMDHLSDMKLPTGGILKTSWLSSLTKKINTTPSLYLEAGAIHGCVLAEEDLPLLYMEDVGRHNAVDKVAGYLIKNKMSAHDKIFYTTGRLTSEMVIKTVKMGIPILVSRSGFTAWSVELAQEAGLTLIGRARGQRFVALSGHERIEFDLPMGQTEEEDKKHRRKGSLDAE